MLRSRPQVGRYADHIRPGRRRLGIRPGQLSADRGYRLPMAVTILSRSEPMLLAMLGLQSAEDSHRVGRYHNPSAARRAAAATVVPMLVAAFRAH
jgi:hypothetical protein